MGDMSLGDCLNAILDVLFPHPPPKPRNPRVRELICMYNPNVPKVARELFRFLEELGADREALERLRRELEESLRRDREIGCIAVYDH